MRTTTLQTTMLTVADVGPTWKLGHEVTDLDFGDATKLPCAGTALNPTIAARLTPVAGVQFEPVDGSYKHLIEFALTGEASRLATDLQLFAEGLELCNHRATEDSETAILEIDKLAIPELGDQRYSYAIAAKVPADAADAGAVWYGRRVLVRAGTVMVDIVLTEIIDSPTAKPQISDADLVRIVEKAVARVKS